MNNQDLKNNGYREDWDFYMCQMDNKVASFFLNLGLHDFAPIADKPNFLSILVKMKNPQDDGLSSNAESETLYAIEDYLDDKIKSNHESIYIGRLTSDGLRSFYFYLGNKNNLDETILEIKSFFTDYEINHGLVEDKEWGHYFNFLYPVPYYMNQITNRRVVRNLQESGDPLTEPREVDHFLYFNSKDDLEDFLEKVKDEEFTEINKKEIKEDDGYIVHQLELKKVHYVDLESIDDFTSYLFIVAEKSGGYYDGWGTTILKDK